MLFRIGASTLPQVKAPDPLLTQCERTLHSTQNVLLWKDIIFLGMIGGGTLDFCPVALFWSCS
ncbi:MAG TPA: hypothetical protein DCE42_15190 [Myxococcales bacterium]|nr:hypothetical protein [Myxococcales bacterium]